MLKKLLVVLAALFALAACGAESDTNKANPSGSPATPAYTATPAPTATSTPIGTASPTATASPVKPEAKEGEK